MALSANLKRMQLMTIYSIPPTSGELLSFQIEFFQVWLLSFTWTQLLTKNTNG